MQQFLTVSTGWPFSPMLSPRTALWVNCITSSGCSSAPSLPDPITVWRRYWPYCKPALATCTGATREISDWFQRLRPEATHADRRDTYARAPDVEPFLGRIEYAAFDVLLNKATWRRRDGVRRSVLDLAAGLDSDKSTVALRKADTTVIFPWIDPFGLFPIDFNVHPHVGPPVVTNMPGFTQEDEAVFIARMKIRNDFSSGETYDIEVLTKHESTPAEGV